MCRFKVGQTYLAPRAYNRSKPNPKGETLQIIAVTGNVLYYEYLETGQEGNCALRGAWAEGMESIELDETGDFNRDAFYVLWNPEASAPTKRHYSLKAAQVESERLMRQCNISQIYILESHTHVIEPKKPSAEFIKIKR